MRGAKGERSAQQKEGQDNPQTAWTTTMEHYATYTNNTLNTHTLPQNPLFAAMVLAHMKTQPGQKNEETPSSEGECRVGKRDVPSAFFVNEVWASHPRFCANKSGSRVQLGDPRVAA
jgi:hypothetical protein